MRTALLKLFGKTEDECVTVPFEYEHYAISKWMSEERSTIFVNYVKLLANVPFVPTDIFEDLYVAVAEDLGENPVDIRVDCTPNYRVVEKVRTFIIEPAYRLENLFV